jgi:hypothetical protein
LKDEIRLVDHSQQIDSDQVRSGAAVGDGRT